MTLTRSVTTQGIQSILFSEIEAWLNIQEIFGEARKEYTHLIRILDAKYLELIREKDADS